MPNLPRIYVFHASDALEQLEELKKILHSMKAEHRIGDFIFLGDLDQLAALEDQVTEDDAIITLLTLNLARPHEVKNILRQMKSRHLKLKVGEIIVDPLSYENKFISFPHDLKPIRGRTDWLTVWDGIGKKLNNIFPVQSTGRSMIDKKTILKYAVPPVVLALVLWFIFQNNDDDRTTREDAFGTGITDEPATSVEDDRSSESGTAVDTLGNTITNDPVTPVEDNISAEAETTRPAAEDLSTIFTHVEETAAPIGGMDAFSEFVGKRIIYPEQAKRMGIEGKVYVQFVVEKDGSLTNVNAVKGIGAGCDEEAVRIVQSAPKWKPGKQHGRPVRQKMVLPISFKQ